MGLFRFLLALSVVLFHSSPIFGWKALSGPLAVHAFFIISGFYMSLILNEKYIKKNGSFTLFITNRILRIYPLYLLTIFAIFLFSLVKFFAGRPGPENITYHFLTYFSYTPLVSFLFELFHFIFRNITLILTTDYFFTPSKITAPLILSQAWSLQVEMLFYLIAPFIVRRSIKTLTLIFLIYLFIFFGFIFPHHLLTTNLLSYLFAWHFLFFFMGIFSYKAYVFLKTKQIPSFVLPVSFFIVILYTVFYYPISSRFFINVGLATDMGYNLIIAFLAPFIFLYGQKWRMDRFFGEASYPVYVLHIFFVKAFYNIPGLHPESSISAIVLIIATLLTSWLFIKLIDKRIDSFRQQRLKK